MTEQQRDRIVLKGPATLMTQPELQVVVSGSLDAIAELQEKAPLTKRRAREYGDYLITAMLVLCSLHGSSRALPLSLTTETLLPPHSVVRRRRRQRGE
jgi:hypothetical protein